MSGWLPSRALLRPRVAGTAARLQLSHRSCQGGIDNVLGDEPDLQLVPPNDIADDQVVGAVVATVGRETIRRALLSHELKPWRKKNVVRSKA